MAIVRIPDERKTLHEAEAIRGHLASIGIGYERWEPAREVAHDAPQEEILAAYAEEIEKLKRSGATDGRRDRRRRDARLDAMLAKFTATWKDEDRCGSSPRARPFHIQRKWPVRPSSRAGDLLSGPRGTRHWFFRPVRDRDIRATTLFQDADGWTPHYTEKRRTKATGRLSGHGLCANPAGAVELLNVQMSAQQTARPAEVEGTTTRRVRYETLFPFARRKVRSSSTTPQLPRGARGRDALKRRIKRTSRRETCRRPGMRLGVARESEVSYATG